MISRYFSMFCERLRSIALTLRHTLYQDDKGSLSVSLSLRLVEKKEKKVQKLCEQLKKLQLQETDREENKVIALGTSKLNYLDPRITVAW